LVIDAIRIRELVNPEELKTEPAEEVTFAPRPLPVGAKSFEQWKSFLVLSSVTGDEPVPEHVYKTVN